MTPEGRIKAKIKKVLDAYGAYYFMPVQMGLGKRTLDFLVCANGHFIGLEAKAQGGKPTMLQEKCIKEIKAAGGLTLVIDDLELVEKLPEWLRKHCG